jgi:hypothetical protein
MSELITLPQPDEIDRRISACREEMTALKRLRRLSLAAQAADPVPLPDERAWDEHFARQ